MTVPTQFSPGKLGILFFSRGRGHGHAIPDMAIADQLEKLQANIDIRFVSYGTGAITFKDHQKPVIDLDMTDSNPLWTTVARAAALIYQMRPDLVISHEEFAVLPVAKAFNVNTVFITEWFSDPADLSMQALSYADDVICIEERGTFGEPPCVEGKVHYTGPVLRQFFYNRSDRDRARQELGFPPDAVIILVAPGGWATEEREPIYDILMPVFDRLRASRKLLVWIAGTDYEMLVAQLNERSDVIVRERDWQMDRLMVASDLAITKGNRITLKELAALGVPSISISRGRNPIDDALIERIPTNTPLDARTINFETLARAVLNAFKCAKHQVSQAGGQIRSPSTNGNGAVLAARQLAARIQTLRRL